MGRAASGFVRRRTVVPVIVLVSICNIAQAVPAKPATKPARPPILEGIVTGPDGKPVADALVLARGPFLSYSEAPLMTRTDAAGRYRIVVRRDEPHRLSVDAKGLAPVLIEKARPGGAPIKVALGRGRSIEGIVCDAATGEGIAGARVQAGGGRAVPLLSEPDGGVREAMADAKGRYRITGVGKGSQEVTATAKGFARGRKSSVGAGGRADFLLLRGSSLTGSVMGPDGKPVSGAVVAIQSELRFSMAANPERTDAKGGFEFAGVEPGTYRLVARAKDLAPGVVSGIAVDAEAGGRVDVVLSAGARVVGRLVGPDEHPTSGQVAVQEIDGQAVPLSLAPFLQTEAGSDGAFRLEAIPPGTHALVVLSPRYAPKRVDVDVRPRQAEVDVGSVVLDAGHAIRGRVTDKAGSGVGAARVHVSAFRPAPGLPRETRTEADGSFQVVLMSPGTYRLLVNAHGFATTRGEATTGEDTMLVLDGGGSITGIALDQDGKPAEAGDIGLEAPPSNETPPRWASGSVDGPDGRFLVEDVAEATYVLTLTVPDRGHATVSDVKVTPGRTTDVGTVRLRSGGVVRGSVVDATGPAVSGATVLVRGLSDSPSFDEGARATTDTSGLFEVHGVSPGPARATASHPDYADGMASPIDVDPAKGPSEVRIVLSRGGRIEGTVRKRDGTPLGRQVVRLSGQAYEASSGDRLVTSTRADGSFAFDHVRPGRTRVMLMAGDASHLQSVQGRDVDVVEGDTAMTEFVLREVLVTGRVTRSEEPVPGLRVSLRAARSYSETHMSFSAAAVPALPSGPQRMNAVTREDGGYELLVDEPGEVFTRVESLDGKVSYRTSKVEVPDSDTFVLDFPLGGTALAGIVVDKDSGQPIAKAVVMVSRTDGGGMGGGRAQTDETGQFQIDVEPGEYKLIASASDHTREEMSVGVGGNGVSALRVELAAGLVIHGKVVDPRGHGAAGIEVSAYADDDPDQFRGLGYVIETAPDGSFRLGGLRSHPYNLFASSPLAGFAIRAAVTPGQEETRLVLRPGGTLRARVLGPDGSPASGAWISVLAVGGAGVSFTGSERKEDGQGQVVLAVPSGNLVLEAQKEKNTGRAVVDVPEGGTAAVEIRLAPKDR
jgi:Carboxypeptidase regulatory-like domain